MVALSLGTATPAGAGDPNGWLDRTRASKAAKDLIGWLATADTLGLDPADYDAAGLDHARRDLDRLRGEPATEAAARFEETLRASATRFVRDLACGRVDPGSLGVSYPPRDCPPADSIVLALLDRRRQRQVLAEAQPAFRSYQLLKNGLARYRALAADSKLRSLPTIEGDIRPGDALPGAAVLRRHLRATGDLAEKRAPKESKDTVYSPELVEAVQRFQFRHGLLPDGILWSPTRQALARPWAERVRAIELALERWRWLPTRFEAPPVIVNIPEFRLEAYRSMPGEGTATLAMDVLVGAAVKSETPVFAAPMTHVVFRPYWEVPASIARDELGPRAAWDRENMERLGYVLVSGRDTTGLPLTASNLARLGRDLRLRQRPGEYNALGRIKFMLPNPEDIYLHDTPADGWFALARRDFSHGCVRVADPVALAAHVLEGVEGWDAARIRQAMDSGEENVRVDLARPLPVYTFYATASAAPNGNIHFHADVYGRDEKLEALLAKRRAGGTKPGEGSP